MTDETTDADVRGSRPPWVWEVLHTDEQEQSWRRHVAWVEWLQDAYEPWISLPPCWPAHEGLRTELRMFWYWHRWVMTSAMDPRDGVRWHDALRAAARAWSDLAGCSHQSPLRHVGDLRRERRERVADHVRRQLASPESAVVQEVRP
jgi:hypothetical protein